MLASAQYFDVFDIDTSDYPIMKAKFYSIGTNGKQILNHKQSDFEITENGEPRNIINLKCPIPTGDPFSIVIAVDVSGSMGGERIKNAAKAIKSFIDLVPDNGSEISIVAFSTKNFYISDFTRNKGQLISKIENLTTFGGTDFDAAFINTLAGSLLTFDKAKHNKKSVILVTDGYAIGNEAEIIKSAKAQNASIHSIIIETAAPEILDNIAKSTGGKVFSNIITESDFNESFSTISYNLTYNPCEIQWKTEATCENFIKLNISNRQTSLAKAIKYLISDKQIIRVVANPYFLNFGSLNKGESVDTTITITALTEDNIVHDIIFEPDNGYFEVLSNLPIKVQKGKSINLSIRYNAIEITQQYSKMKVISEYCESSIGLLGGNSNRPLLKRTLELTMPNGGESFIAGIDTIITWKGISELGKIELYFSSNNGKDWELITNSGYDLIHNWKTPPVISDSCLISIDLFATDDKPREIGWSKAFGGTNSDVVSSIYRTKDGGCIVAGYSTSDDEDLNISGNKGNTDYWIIKLSVNGGLEWSKSYGGTNADIATSVIETYDGGYIVAGHTQSSDGDLATLGNKGAKDYWITKLRSTGDIEWSRTYGGTRNEEAKSIIQTFEGGYIIVGRSTSNDGDLERDEVRFDDYWILKLFENGDIEWSKTYGGSEFEIANCVIQTSDAGFLIAGNSKSNDGDLKDIGNRGEIDTWLIKLNSKGDIEWSKIFGGSKDDLVNSVIQTFDDGFFICGYTLSNDGDLENKGSKGKSDYWVIKLNKNGQLEWTNIYGGSEDDIAESAIQSLDGGYIVAGSSNSKNGDLKSSNKGEKDYWIIKLNSNGFIEWSKTYGGTLNDEIASITHTIDGGFIASGNSFSTNGDLGKVITKGSSDAWVLKFNPPISFQSDTSDAVFSIIMPEPVIQNNDIDLGEMIVGSTKDTIVSSIICNTGDAPLHILGVDITGGDFNDFLIPRGAGDFYLNKGECQDMMYEFTPSSLGNRTAVATIRTTIGNFSDTIHIRGVGINPVIEATAEVVDFGVFELGEGKDTTVVLVKNVGSTDITITDTRISGPDTEQFTLNTAPITFTIPVGQEKEFQLNYTAKYGGKSNSFLDFHYDGIGSPIRSLLFAEGIGGEVYPQVADAFVGETVELGIFLGKIKPEGLSEIATNFSATVSYNSTLLAPIDKSILVTTEDNKSYINIEGQLSGMNQIAAVPMKVGLGTAVKSGLLITKFQLYDANGDSVDYDIEPGVGEFNVLGICEEGGVRLINPNGEAVDMVVTTDGLNSNARINLTLIETGQTDLVIFDQIGNKIETVYSGTPSAGQQEINLNLSKYTNGRYYIKLTTPTITKTEIIEVVR